MNFGIILPIVFLCMVRLILVASVMERHAIYKGASSFDGLSQDVKEISKRRCAARLEFLYFVSQVIIMLIGDS